MADDTPRHAGALSQVTLVTHRRTFALGHKAFAADGQTLIEHAPRSLATEAMRLNYSLRSRERWPDTPAMREQQQREAAVLLHGFGLTTEHLRELAVAGPVVVRMPFVEEAQGWDARIFPWEFVLARATRPWRTAGTPTMTVMRELALSPSWTRARKWAKAGSAEAMRRQAPAPRVLFIQSFPGALLKSYDAAHERDRVRRAFGLAADDAAHWCELMHPTLDELRAACERFVPQVVHLAGCDTHQGLVLLRQHGGADTVVYQGQTPLRVADLIGRRDDVRDGYLLMHESGQPSVVDPVELGQALLAGGQPPFFVGLNIWHSAARLAPLLLSEGVLASLGFQDSFDDALAEYFFETLYRRLPRLNWQLPQAFAESWAELRQQTDLMPGTGIALWARAPLIGPAVQAAEHEEVVRDPVEWDIRPKTAVNYAELHNRGSLFERFVGQCAAPELRPRVLVEVELHCGEERARYEWNQVVDRGRVALHDDIVVPLTARLMRTVSEAIVSSLLVRISVNGNVQQSRTWPVRLLPVDQWRDNLRSGRWLPSFVLPRDPAVERAVASAQRYVRVIRDDPSAGFEGYQGATPDNEASLENVDLQVEALWATLLHDWQLGYINPPPSYSAELDSQRLRTPSAIHALRMGTCIDLALLFAACLELVDIYPVVFLLDGHALPGYWRHGDWLQQFREALPPAADVPSGEAEPAQGDARVQRAPWWTTDHDTIWRLVRQGRLVPLETVRLTEHSGFREAREAGIEALRRAADFDSVLDIAIARVKQVTPLPILGDAP